MISFRFCSSSFYLVYGLRRVAITKLDILDTLAEIRVGVSYSLNGKKIDYFPTSMADLGAVEVILGFI